MPGLQHTLSRKSASTVIVFALPEQDSVVRVIEDFDRRACAGTARGQTKRDRTDKRE